MGSPVAPRMEATRPSSGSFQPLISTSTTSGRMRSRRSRKLPISPMSWCSTMMRNGSSARQACACSQRSRFSIASPMVSGYIADLQIAGSRPAAPGAMRRRAAPGLRRRHRRHGYDLESRGGAERTLAWPCCRFCSSCSTASNAAGGCTGDRPGLIHARLRRARRCRSQDEGDVKAQIGRLLPGGNRPHHFRRDDHQQLGVACGWSAWSGTACPESGMSPMPGTLREGLGDLVVHQPGDDEALPALQFHFGLHPRLVRAGNGEAR